MLRAPATMDARGYRQAATPGYLRRRPGAELPRRDRDHAGELARIETAGEARATALEEARADLRARAERAERELDQACDEMGRQRQDAGRDGEEHAPPRPARRRRSGQPPQER